LFYFRKSQFQRVEVEIDQLMFELSDLEDKIFAAKVEISQWEQKKKLTLENLDILKNELEEIRHASQTEDESEPLMKFD
jgi:chromosome segregation ATPase